MTKQNSKQETCKGFWAMCACPKCRAEDEALEKRMDKMTPVERAAIRSQAESAILKRGKR